MQAILNLIKPRKISLNFWRSQRRDRKTQGSGACLEGMTHRNGESCGPPGLKAGVTADVAFQVGCAGFPDMRYGCRRSPCQRWITPGSPAAIDREDRFTRQVKGAVNMLFSKKCYNHSYILIEFLG